MMAWAIQFIAPTPEAADKAAKAEFLKTARLNPNHNAIHAATRLIINQMPTVKDRWVRVQCSGHIDTRNGHSSARVELTVELVRVIDAP